MTGKICLEPRPAFWKVPEYIADQVHDKVVIQNYEEHHKHNGCGLKPLLKHNTVADSFHQKTSKKRVRFKDEAIEEEEQQKQTNKVRLCMFNKLKKYYDFSYCLYISLICKKVNAVLSFIK